MEKKKHKVTPKFEVQILHNKPPSTVDGKGKQYRRERKKSKRKKKEKKKKRNTYDKIVKCLRDFFF